MAKISLLTPGARFSRFLKGFSVILFLILAPYFIAGDKPLVASRNNHIAFPFLMQASSDLFGFHPSLEWKNIQWRDTTFVHWAVFPIVPFSPGTLDIQNAGLTGPFDVQVTGNTGMRHWLGTDTLGRDVLSGMVHGFSFSIILVLLSLAIAIVLALMMGSLAGFLGEKKIHASWISIGVFLFLLPWVPYEWMVAKKYFFVLDETPAFLSVFEGLFFLCWFFLVSSFAFSSRLISKIPGWLNFGFTVKVDFLVIRFLEIFSSIPLFFLLVALLTISEPSPGLVIFSIGITSWTGMAKYLRADLLKLRNAGFMESSLALGFPDFRRLFFHALPNATSSMMVAASFAAGNAILIESGLSFLGIGMPAETVTWGTILSGARMNPEAWWLAVFPGLAIFATIYFFNRVAEKIRRNSIS